MWSLVNNEMVSFIEAGPTGAARTFIIDVGGVSCSQHGAKVYKGEL
jgi:hypothetical protein